MRVHLVQLDLVWEDRGANLALAASTIKGARPSPGDLVVLPELFDSGFSLNVDANADDRDETRDGLRSIAARFGVVVHGSRTVRARSGMGLNTATVIGPDGGTLVEYAKIHPFSFGREPERFEGGTAPAVYDAGGLNVCPVVCYDLRFPELFRAGIELGATAFAIGANWPDARQDHWRALCLARAIENQAYVFAVNRAGRDPFLSYAGGSIAVDPRGRVLGELDADAGVLSIEAEPGVVERWRAAFPALKDRRLGVRAPRFPGAND